MSSDPLPDTSVHRLPLAWEVAPQSSAEAVPEHFISAQVPGAVQLDWARAHDWPPYWAAENFRAYDGLEDKFWIYRAVVPDLTPPFPGARLFFTSRGVDYRFEIHLGETVLHTQEGMFAPTEIELTSHACTGDVLQVVVHPAPKSCATPADRKQADHSCKPAVSYGWDFHPRLIPLGIWDETGLEWRQPTFFASAETHYTLSEDLTSADLRLHFSLDGEPGGHRVRWTLRAPCGRILFVHDNAKPGAGSTMASPALWWPHDQGEPALHTSTVELIDAGGEVVEARIQRLGFRRVRLVMAPGQWKFPRTFPKPRSHPPMTLEVNGHALFAKGANWVSPEIFPGLLRAETYREQLALVRGANLNLLRMWGGAPAQKEAFYDICDELGIMVWQEFPLSCNCYPDDPAYLEVLDRESRALILRLRPHASVVLWCGGNELFNAWSGMTDQSLPLRLLGRNCYDLDPSRPFLHTSPVDGVGHGHYVFRDPVTGEEAWALFQRAQNTAYCEFGVPGPAPLDVLREIIPAGELFPPAPGGAWEAHHAFGAWMKSSHLYLDVMEHYFGPAGSIEEIVARGQLLQCEGYKGLFEEARRQKLVASMAVCWCLNEPWPTAANLSLISWPSRPKPALAAVGEACRPLLASARISKFSWQEGEPFDPELWWLNDSPTETTPGPVQACVEAADGRRYPLLTWDGGTLSANTNLVGPRLRWIIPPLGGDLFFLVLDTPDNPAAASRYTLQFKPLPKETVANRTMNLA